ncbi:hypothetical protein FXN61_24880 [Lentzea sp. PSKA42]|uniref:Lipoprotein with Yx(FWY)xxD motif n=2 Tax=Lentzea indica TaxID=2604800 RepID=A0ABX1FMU2_9PSEU|nr:hypothetical protein [Lentzea indica]
MGTSQEVEMIRKTVTVVALGLISLTACAGTPESKPVAQQQESVVALKIAEIDDLGPVVTDVEGFTLYRFDGDKPNESTCDGECAATWPPATVADENFTVEGVDEVGSFVRKDGSRQLTVDGMPQYRFAKDVKPGETKGQGLQGKWFATGKSGERTQLAARTGVIAGLGAVLTNSAGLTLYRFDGDTAQPPASNCDGGCAATWPPVYVEGEQPRVKGVDPKLLGTITRKDGKKQLTVANWPQYTFKNDSKPGEAKGVTVPKWFATATTARRPSRTRRSRSPVRPSGTSGSSPPTPTG